MIIIFEIDFYQKENGRVPVKEFLLSLNPKLRAKAILDIELLQEHGNELKEPYVKPIKGKNNKYILLNGFIKKSMKTPRKEIARALRYMQDYKNRQ